jgi:cytoskeletal protein CcmA (bactofilin family)
MRRHRDAERRAIRVAGWTAAALLAALLAPPIAALPEEDQGFSDFGGNYVIPEGKTHHGKLRLFKGTVTIAGKQDGDLWVFGGTLEIPGEVTGKVRFFGNSLNVTGKVGGPVDAKGATCRIAGTVGEDLDAKCGTAELAAGAHVLGNATLYAGQISVNGAVDGDLDAEGGQIELSGSVGKDASLRADVIKIDDKAKIAGNLSHESRVPMSLDGKDIVGGKIDRDHVTRVHVEHHPSFLSRFGVWLGLLLLGLLVGLAALALTGKAGEAVVGAARSDVLRNLGVGFLAFIVIPVAAVVSCILIVTIPLALAVILLWALAVYLAKVPVAVSAGRWLLLKLGRPEPSRYGAFFSGMVSLYLLFAIPVLGWILWFAVVFLGLGAMFVGIRDWRQARKAAATSPVGGPPAAAPDVPAIEPPAASSEPPPEAV